MPTQSFTNGNDTFTVSSPGTYDLAFLAGEDRLIVNAAASVIAQMGEGNDLVDLRVGMTTAYGELGADRFEIRAAGSALYGGGDNDLFNLRAGANNTTADGEDGNDRFNFAAAVTTILLHGGAGNDDFAGFDFASIGSVYGDAGNDTFTGFRSGVTLNGGTGDDVYRVNPGSNAAFVELAAAGKDSVQLMRGADYTLPDNIENIVIGTYAGSDASGATITFNALDNAFTGHGNDEIVFGLGGNDRLNGKGGADTLNGGDGNDVLDGGTGNDILHGDAGNDSLIGRDGADTMAGGAGNDIYYVDTPGDTVTENSGEGTDTVRVLAAVADISLGGYTLPGNVEIGIIIGGAPGIETYVAGNVLDNVLIGSLSSDVLDGTKGNGDDELRGGAGDDQLTAGLGNDLLSGGDGDDVLASFGGNDTMLGGNGDDRLYGSDDDDLFIGGPDQDSITTGGGADVIVYQFASDAIFDSSGFFREQIDDFDVSLDRIDLSAIDADLSSDFYQPFHFTGTTADGTTGDVWLEAAEDPDWYFLWAENSGDGIPDVAILLFLPGGAASFTADNLIL